MNDQSASGPLPPFLALPAEIRTAIYERLFLGSRTRLTSGDDWDFRESRHQILLTCRRCHAEARHLFSSLNIWSFDSDTQLHDFFGPSRHGNIASHVKHLQVTDQIGFRRLCTSLAVDDSLQIFSSLETLSGHVDLFGPLKRADEVKELNDEELRTWVLNNIRSGTWDLYHIAETIRQRPGLSVLLSVRVIFRNGGGNMPELRFFTSFDREEFPLPAHTLDVLVNITKPEIIRPGDGLQLFRVFRGDLSIML